MWYDGNKTLTHNCLFNIIIGNRGCGKTHWGKDKALKNFLRKGEQFVYLRRYDSELELVKDSLFNDMLELDEYKDKEIISKGDNFYCDGVVFGYSMALTKASYYKSSSFPRVSLIIFDECFIDVGGTTRYLKNEVQKFLEFYETIARQRDVIVFFLSNAISFVNPYTMYWNLRLPYGKDIVKKDDLILLQLVMNQEFIEEKRKTRFGRLIEGTAYGDYAVNNKFLKDNNEFIEKKTGNCSYYFTFKYLDSFYGVWVSYQLGKFWVSEDVDPTYKLVYSFTLDDHTPNTTLLNSINKAILVKTFIENYKQSNVYFESQKIKNVVYDVIKMTIN